MKKKVTLLIAAILVVIFGFYVMNIYLPIEGTVMDSETKQPIEGAIVLVWWTIQKGVPGLTYGTTYQLAETVTDKNGKFRINTYVLNPFVNRPDLTIYKAGYVCWNNNYTFPGLKQRAGFRWNSNREYLLEKFRSEYSHTDHVSFITSFRPALDSRDPFEKAYEWERTMSSKELDIRK